MGVLHNVLENHLPPTSTGPQRNEVGCSSKTAYTILNAAEFEVSKAVFFKMSQ
jgi:hypothetical protein